jgi:uncharacterized protein YbaR (Trm112 family)
MDSPLQSPLVCPVCRAPLVLDGKMYGCGNGHPFNIAKEGYINLLLSHQRSLCSAVQFDFRFALF